MQLYRCAAIRPFLFCTDCPRSYNVQDAASSGSLRILPALLKMTILFIIALGQGLQYNVFNPLRAQYVRVVRTSRPVVCESEAQSSR